MKKLSIISLVFLFANGVLAFNDYGRPVNSISKKDCLGTQFASLPKTHHKIVVIAHRGSHLEVPENTLAAYERAIKDGADYVEIDLRTTKDGHLVIMHDESINKMTGDTGLIKSMSYNEIRNLKIKPNRMEDTNTYRIPDFKSVLNLCKGKINIYLDFKDADVKKTYKLIKKAGMQNNVVVYLNKEAQYGQWRKVVPHIPLMASLPENMNNTQLENLLDKMPLEIVDNAYEKEKLDLMHKKKIAVWLDVQSKEEGPENWEMALKEGADGLQTDHPEKLIKFLEKEGKR